MSPKPMRSPAACVSLRVVNGERRVIADRPRALLPARRTRSRSGPWTKKEEGDESFSVSLDGEILLEVHDAALAAAGRFGVASRADSQTRFGDLFITVLD